MVGNGGPMTVIWLSPDLAVDRDQVAALLTDQHVVATATALPPRDSLAVVTSDERQLLTALAARPADISLLLVAPAGREVPRELAEEVRAETVGTITGDQDAAELIAAAAGRRRAATAWPDYRRSVPAEAKAAAGAEGKGPLGRPRVQLVASALVALAIIVAAVLVVTNSDSGSAAATSGSGTTTTGQGMAGGSGEGGVGSAGGMGGSGAGAPALTTAQITKLVACLKEKGVTVSSGTTTLPKLDMSNATVRTAMQSCGTALGLGAGPGAGGAGSGAAGPGTGSGAAPSGRPSARVTA